MTDRTFTLNIDQIKQIYSAGIRRGGDEQSAHDWGCSPSGKEYDELIDSFSDIVNDKKNWDDPDYKDWSTIESWFKERK